MFAKTNEYYGNLFEGRRLKLLLQRLQQIIKFFLGGYGAPPLQIRNKLKSLNLNFKNFRTVPFCRLTKEGQSLEILSQQIKIF